MEKLLILGASKGSSQLINAAKQRGIWTAIAGPKGWSRSLEDYEVDDVWYVDTADLDTLEKKCRSEGITGILCGVSQFNVQNVISLTDRLGLPCYCTSEAWKYTVDKRQFKNLCRRNGVPVAKDYAPNGHLSSEELDDLVFPVVVKAIDLSANRGMSFCSTREEVLAACEYARSASKSDEVIVEKMLSGREYTAHYALDGGEATLLNLCAMFHEPGYPVNCYSLTTTATDRLHQYLEEVDPFFRRALRDAGATNGVAWVELMLDSDGHFYALEMGYRMSGDLWALPMKTSCSFDTYGWLIDNALGQPHPKDNLPVDQESLPQRCGATYILWSDHDGEIGNMSGLDVVEGLEEVTAIDSSLSVGDRVTANSYMVVVTINASDHLHAEKVIETINEVVSIEDKTGRDLIIRFDDFGSVRSVAQAGIEAEEDRGLNSQCD